MVVFRGTDVALRGQGQPLTKSGFEFLIRSYIHAARPLLGRAASRSDSATSLAFGWSSNQVHARVRRGGWVLVTLGDIFRGKRAFSRVLHRKVHRVVYLDLSRITPY